MGVRNRYKISAFGGKYINNNKTYSVKIHIQNIFHIIILPENQTVWINLRSIFTWNFITKMKLHFSYNIVTRDMGCTYDFLIKRLT